MSRLLPWIFAVTLVAAALAVAPGFLFYYDVTPKAVVALLGGAAVCAMVGQWAGGVRQLWNCAPGKLLLLGLALGAFAAVLATAWSLDPALSATGSEWRRLGLGVELALAVSTLALAAWAAGAPERVRWILRAVAMASLAGAVYGTAQYFGLDPLQPAERYVVGEGEWAIVRPPGTLGHAGYAATFLLHGVFAGVALALADAGKWRRLGAISAGLSAVAIALSGSRSALLGLAVGGLVLATTLRPRIWRRGALAAIALALAAVAFYAAPTGERLRARVRWSGEDPGGGGRLLLWRDAAGLAAENWLAGTGPETFSAAFLPYHSVELSQRLPEQYYESPHNILLDAACSKGVLGLLALLAIVAAGAWGAWRDRSKLAYCLLAGLLATLVSQQFLAFTAATQLYFFAWAALSTALAATQETSRERRLPSLRVIGLAASVGFVWLAWGLLRADWQLERVRAAIEAGDPAAAADRYERFLQVKPAGFYADLWFSLEMRRAAMSVEGTQASRLWLAARQAARRAVERSETPQNTHYNLAAIHAEEGDPAAVERDLEAAIAAAPHWYRPYSMLAQVYLVTQRREQAIGPVRRALELTDGANARVRAVAAELGVATAPE